MRAYDCMYGGKNQDIANWIAAAQGMKPRLWSGNFNTLWFMDSRGLKVAWLYVNPTGADISVHVSARPGALWCHPTILKHVFGYPFLQLNCRRLTATIAAKNAVTRKAAEALGFKLEGRLREAELSGDDLVIYGMLRGECRWISQEAQHALAV